MKARRAKENKRRPTAREIDDADRTANRDAALPTALNRSKERKQETFA